MTDTTTDFPTLRLTAIDTPDPRGLAEFYRRLLGYRYRAGDEPREGEGTPEWLVLHGDAGEKLAFQVSPGLPRAQWPEGTVPQMMHLDLTVPDTAALSRQHDRALDLGATVLLDRSNDPEEELYVYADPSGHPFCIFVSDQ
ncbi:VOC family protein [Marisediminicola sp. LYQ134]|uniref:VOC family protein n=1 Tax=Marisediminicola sp. LYQ134 TaxID=3391061 RepID=UPI0039830757